MSVLPIPAVRDSKYSQYVLYAIASALAYTSATCVTGLMAAAAECCDVDEEEKAAVQEGKGRKLEDRLPRGRALGGFRSKVGTGSYMQSDVERLTVLTRNGRVIVRQGQLGRAIGPLLATFTYWTLGPTVVYALSAVALASLAMTMSGMVRSEVARRKWKTA
jgi:hypothetical protein